MSVQIRGELGPICKGSLESMSRVGILFGSRWGALKITMMLMAVIANTYIAIYVYQH